ncbi:nucleotidyltransferase domain-containing protein [Nanoarchaeota archaeon]
MEDEKKKAEELLKNAPNPEVNKKEMEKERQKIMKELEQLKDKLEKFKKDALKKFPFITSISLIPPEASKLFEEEGMKNEKDKLFFHVYVTMPDDKAKEYPKVKTWMIKTSQEIKPRIWVHLSLTSDVWELCQDGKFEMIDAIAASRPVLHDKGVLGALRVANVHKILCLKKFESYIVSYVLAGSIVRGQAVKTSDVDVTIIIDDTDVKRMSRMELRDKLRSIILDYVYDAGEIAGVQNKLSPQVWLLTDFWEGIREANPVYFTFVRDGVPLYDNRTFMPWKLLLKMGKITGTPEAIERMVSQGEGVTKVVKKKLLDIATGEIYWSIIYPSQGALMLYGLAPPNPRETVKIMREVFYEKEKLLEKKYIDFLDRVVTLYKGYEHETVKEVSGKEIDELVKGSGEYLDRIKKLVKEVGERMSKQTIMRLSIEVMQLLSAILGKGNEKQILKKFSKDLIETGKLPPTSQKILDELIKEKDRCQKKDVKIKKLEFERLRKDVLQLIGNLTEYAQRGKVEFEAKRKPKKETKKKK